MRFENKFKMLSHVFSHVRVYSVKFNENLLNLKIEVIVYELNVYIFPLKSCLQLVDFYSRLLLSSHSSP